MTRYSSGARSSTPSSSDSARSTPAESTTATSSEQTSDAVALPQEFKVSKLAYFAVPATFLVVLILAGTSLAWFGWTFAVPVLLAVWIWRIKTVVTEDGLRAVGTFGSREVAWPDIEGLQFSRWGPVRAVLTDGDRVRLPAITFQDMPRLSAASAGRIPDPFAAARDAR
ncbi:PH domain-containing protein [Gordonia polyisoprenivorans]|uniref:PH domain-containing protein n=1 Tax=Gordonia polyisoprenivorans TaxID=84595 RepID=UPI001B8AA279|nr:PH domain-containing protein [Gordonia polyisoprenivorans]QUD84463.1 PH domain-containing protein [Gordonia polyisoprenivorans]UZF54448.1 PH domain-containing protein [Gordonia polyisoprenivorans]